MQVELTFGVPTACAPGDPGRLPYGVGAGAKVVRRYQEARHAVRNHLAEPSATKRDYRSAARLRLGGGHPEGLVPPGWAQDNGSARHDLPQRCPRHSLMNRDSRPSRARGDLLARVVSVVCVAVDVDRDPGRASDVDGFGCSLFRAQSAGENGAITGLSRPRDATRGHARSKDPVDRHNLAPGPRLECRHGRYGRRTSRPAHLLERRCNSAVGW